MNTAFSRFLLSDAVQEIRKARPGIRVSKASLTQDLLGTYSFLFEEVYWYGKAEDAYHARAKGWRAVLAAMENKQKASSAAA